MPGRRYRIHAADPQSPGPAFAASAIAA